jgi:hypothetical protein
MAGSHSFKPWVAAQGMVAAASGRFFGVVEVNFI